VTHVQLGHDVLVMAEGDLVDGEAGALAGAVVAMPEDARLVLDLSRVRGIDRAGARAVRHLCDAVAHDVVVFAQRRRVRRALRRCGAPRLRLAAAATA